MPDDLDTYDPVRGAARELVDANELSNPDDLVSVILDRRRRRPMYLDDRFLTARDLTRGQQYNLLRQADLAQVSGGGVVHGLGVRTNAKGTALRVAAGMGVARSGESIALRQGTTIRIASLRVLSPRRVADRLVATRPQERARTGLFMLVARPVEHARALGTVFVEGTVGKFELEEGELVEGTWFSLTPLPSARKKDAVARGRARLAREVFVGGFDVTALTDGLPLAVVGVVGGRVQWVDEALAARDVGGDATLGFGLSPRKRRAAFEEQFAEHLEEEVERRRNAGLPDGLAAVEAFDALPPVGPLPRGAVEVTAREVQQSFFPREIYVEVAIMPEDEVPALLAEGLVRAPIDLSEPEHLENVPVLIVVPVPRAGFDQRAARMEGIFRSPALAPTGRALVKARPIDALTVLRLRNEPPVDSDPVPLDLEAWRHAIESAPQLWYVRRPQFAVTSAVVPRGVVSDNEIPASERIGSLPRMRIFGAGETERFDFLFRGASQPVLDAMEEILMSRLLGPTSAPADEHAPATVTSVYISGMLGELAYLARRPRPQDTATKGEPPRSPVFETYERADALRLRALELTDIERLAERYAVPGIYLRLRRKEFRDAALRSVLSTAAVVPELAVWTNTPQFAVAGGYAHLLDLVRAADVTGLRTAVEDIVLEPITLRPIDTPGIPEPGDPSPFPTPTPTPIPIPGPGLPTPGSGFPRLPGPFLPDPFDPEPDGPQPIPVPPTDPLPEPGPGPVEPLPPIGPVPIDPPFPPRPPVVPEPLPPVRPTPVRPFPPSPTPVEPVGPVTPVMTPVRPTPDIRSVERPEDAVSFGSISNLGEATSLRALWAPADDAFRRRLDEAASREGVGDSPLYIAPVLMGLVTVGFDLPAETDRDAEAILAALGRIRSTRPFRSPNGDAGEVLARAEHSARDTVLRAAERVDADDLATATARLEAAGFATGGRRVQRVDAHRLLALASGGFDHISAIAKADDEAFEAFVAEAAAAASSRSLTAMRKALTLLAAERPG